MAIFVCFESCQSNTAPHQWNDKEAMVMALKWQEAHPIFARGPSDWTNGAYYTGVYKAHQSTNDSFFLDALTQMAVRNEWKPWERFFHADDLAITASYLYLKRIGVEGVNLAPTDTIIQQHLYKPCDWRSGKPMDGFDIDFYEQQVILWWWCDALFMSPPVLAMYAKEKNDLSYLDEMHKYYVQTYDLLFDQEQKLFARDTRFIWRGDSTDIKESNGNKVFWSRGNGWVFGGLALLLENMPSNYAHRQFYEELYKTMAVRLTEIQPEDGLWRTSLLCPESFDHGEVSGTGFFTFALTWGINNGMLDRVMYEPAVRKAWTALRECQKADGMVGWVQNIGGSPEPANHDSWQNYGTGAFLLAGSEILKLDASTEDGQMVHN
ncbi:MAG TPA: glycoside hydrolase family 88 protein [Bacteroides sp.]|nr:glycoside hydrolase family 88 protein [Bacteroides sp.]